MFFSVNASWPWCFLRDILMSFFPFVRAVSRSSLASVIERFHFFFRGKFIFRGDCAQRSLVYEYDYEYRYGLFSSSLLSLFLYLNRSTDVPALESLCEHGIQWGYHTTQSLLLINLCT